MALSGDGTTALVGGRGVGTPQGVGAAWVFVRSGSTWSQQGSKLVGTGAVGDAGEGSSVALSGDGRATLVGGPRDNGGAGAVWVYARSGSTWPQQGSKLVGTGAVGDAGEGSSVALSADGSTALVGAPSDNGGVGAAWVFAFVSQHTLSVTRGGSGAGTVTSVPAGIDCGSSCAAPFTADGSVTLTAAPAAGSTFTG